MPQSKNISRGRSSTSLEQKYDEAIVEYRNALQQDPKFADARFKLAEAYVAKNDYRTPIPNTSARPT